MSAPELKPCPSCLDGGEPDPCFALAQVRDGVATHEPGCNRCGFTAPDVATWNRRSTPHQTDLDRAWAWFRADRYNGLTPTLPWRVISVASAKSLGTGPTKDAAVLGAWRAAMGKEGQQ